MRTDARDRGAGRAHAFVALLMAAPPGCAFADGRPWGALELEVTARLDEADRATGEGYRTSNDYLVRVDALEVTFDAVTVAMASEAGAGSFDPADPPPGFSLCHNGHCHASDGRLVDYADVAAELAGASASGATVTATLHTARSVTPVATVVPVEGCSDDCALPAGTIALATLTTTGVSARLHVQDRRPGDWSRLPEGGVALDLELAEIVDFDAALRAPVDGRAPPVVGLDIEFVVPATLFDGVDWGDTATRGAALAARFRETGGISAGVRRRRFE